jgi:hypothetical protein
MKTSILSIIATFIYSQCLTADEVKISLSKPPAIELQFGLQLEYPSLRIIGRMQNNKLPIFRTCFLGENDNPLVFRNLDGRSMKTSDGRNMIMLTFEEYEEPCVKPIQFRVGEAAWLDEKIRSISRCLTIDKSQDGFLEIVWQNWGIRVQKEINNGKHFESNGITFYFDGGFKKFDPATIPIRQDLDLVFAPKIILYDYVKFTKDCYESRDLVFFMRNNAKKKILEVQNESIVVLTADGKPAMVDGVPFSIAVTKGTALEPGKSLKESQSLLAVCSAFAKTRLPAGFYRLRWQVEVSYEDNEKKSFSSNELWVYHGKYEATKGAEKDLE